jgi:hypothetical protein
MILNMTKRDLEGSESLSRIPNPTFPKSHPNDISLSEWIQRANYNQSLPAGGKGGSFQSNLETTRLGEHDGTVWMRE